MFLFNFSMCHLYIFQKIFCLVKIRPWRPSSPLLSHAFGAEVLSSSNLNVLKGSLKWCCNRLYLYNKMVVVPFHKPFFLNEFFTYLLRVQKYKLSKMCNVAETVLGFLFCFIFAIIFALRNFLKLRYFFQ